MGCSESKPEKNKIGPKKANTSEEVIKMSGDVISIDKSPNKSGGSSEFPIYRTRIDRNDEKTIQGLWRNFLIPLHQYTILRQLGQQSRLSQSLNALKEFYKDGPFPASFSLFSSFLRYNW